MKAYAKPLNTRITSATALAVAKIVFSLGFLLACAGTLAANRFAFYFFHFGLPAVNLTSGIFFALFLWLAASAILDFSAIRRTKELGEALESGPVSFSVLRETMRRSEKGLLRDVTAIKNRRLFSSVAVLEDCVVFEAGGAARPLMLMADRGMRFASGKSRRMTTPFFIALLLGLSVGIPYATRAWYAAILLVVMINLLIYALRKPRFSLVSLSAAPAVQDVPAPQEPSTGNSEADELIAGAALHIRDLCALDVAIEDEYVSERIREIVACTRQLMEFLRRNPHRHAQIRQLVEYALPTAIKLLGQYDYLNRQPVKGENIRKSMDKIVEMSGSVAETLKRELDALYADGAIDIEVDVAVMRTMLQQEALEFDRGEPQK